jgi:hypothetical protein
MSYSPATIRSILERCADDVVYFGRVVAPVYFKHESPTFHRHMLHKINNLPQDKNIIVVEAPRGNSKTFLVSTLNGLHRCLFAGPKKERIKYIIIASYSATKARQIIADYRNIIIGENFQGIFPGTVLLKDREDMIEVENKELGIKFMVMARGRESQITGLRYEESRPGLFVADDLEDPDESYNQEIVDRNCRFIDEAVQFGLDPNGFSVLIGTPFSFDCFTERFSKREAGVVVIKYPQLVETEEMAIELGVPIGKSIWEDRFPTARMEKDRDDAITNGTIDLWLRQRQLRAVSDSQVRFNMNKITEIKDDDRFEFLKDKKLNIYILSDYAYSKKIYADESAIIAFGMDDQANYYILFSDCGKWGDIGTTEKIVNLVRVYQKQLRCVGVEARGYGFIEQRMLQVKRELNISFSCVPLEPKNRGKAERIKSMISVVEDGRVFFVGSQNKLKANIASFRGEEVSHGDDLRDIFGYMPDVAAKPVTEKTKEERAKEENHRLFQQFAAEIDKQHEKPRTVWSVNRDEYY